MVAKICICVQCRGERGCRTVGSGACVKLLDSINFFHFFVVPISGLNISQRPWCRPPPKTPEEVLEKVIGDYDKAIEASKRTNKEVNQRIEELRKEAGKQDL